MKEDILHFIWKHQLFEKDIFSKDQECIEVLNPGSHNMNSGPDFLEAKVRIGQTIWAGSIEIHINASDWKRHKHHLDKKYQNVILHVVFNDDLSASDRKRLNVPVLELSGFMHENIVNRYEELNSSQLWIPCQKSVHNILPLKKIMWVERLVIERLEHRYNQISSLVENNGNDWLESFYQFIARSFGFNVNNDAFEELAKSIPLKFISKHKNDQFQIEALLFGQSGLLNAYQEDEYPNKLQLEYKFLSKKYKLLPMSSTLWNFSRLRPSNFPTIRISQFANLLFRSSMLFSRLLETERLSEIQNLFTSEASDYWKTHYSFDRFTTQKRKRVLGQKSVDSLIINTVIPFIFVYASFHQNQDLKRKAVGFLYELKAEKNSILEKWESFGFENKNAAESQALLHLKKVYCNKKRCLDCNIGVEIIHAS